MRARVPVVERYGGHVETTLQESSRQQGNATIEVTELDVQTTYPAFSWDQVKELHPYLDMQSSR